MDSGFNPADFFDCIQGNVAQGLFAIARAVETLTDQVMELKVQVNRLGNGDLENPGAIEILGDRLTDKLEETNEHLVQVKEAAELISAPKQE